MFLKNKLISLSILVFVVIAVVAYLGFRGQGVSNAPNPIGKIVIDNSSGNYGRFIEGEDNNYFATRDANVRNIIRTYLTNPTGFTDPTDAQKYGFTLIYYYNKDNFIVAEKTDPVSNVIMGFTMYNMKTGQQISNCAIIPNAGLYKNNDLLLSASFIGVAPYTKQGICLYERGTPNFTFIDLSSKLSSTETIFNDSTGRSLNATIKNVDTQNKTLVVYVYNTTKKDADGNYAYKRSMKISY